MINVVAHKLLKISGIMSLIETSIIIVPKGSHEKNREKKYHFSNMKIRGFNMRVYN